MTTEFTGTDRSMEFLSVIIATEPMKELTEVLSAARTGLDPLGLPYEVICITDGHNTQMIATLREMRAGWPELVVLGQRPWSGDDAALTVALRRARGTLVLTTAGWPEVAPEGFAALLAGLGDADMVSATRTGLPGGRWQRLRRDTFRRALGWLFGQSPSDPFCRTRLTRKPVLEDVAAFGVRQHFIPVIASERGYKINEVAMPSAGDGGPVAGTHYVFRPLGHLIAFLDALTLYVVLKFLRRPLRFFGSIGLPIFLLGALATAALLIQRLFGEPLADRPALIFSVLMVVLGIQILAIGLVGEIIIFANSRRMKQYLVREIIRQDEPADPHPDAPRHIAPSQAVE